MNWLDFHDPDISLPVVGRRVKEEVLDLIAGVGCMLATSGRSLQWSQNEDCHHARACYQAVRRLKKAGFVASRGQHGHSPILELTESGAANLAWGMKPQREWDREWNGIWYVLAYDVPERQKSYRESLRSFLRRLRMGCLQRSVWVTHRDIRPDYDDLVQAAEADRFSFLLEARTVLGRDRQDVVLQSWNWERIDRIQNRYLDACQANLDLLNRSRPSHQDLMQLAVEESASYRAAMAEDPLLSRSLLPGAYQGERTLTMHERFTRSLADHL